MMTRFFNGWMGCKPCFILDFQEELGDEEYKTDILACGALSLVLLYIWLQY